MRRCSICPYHKYIENLTGEDINETSCGLEECRVTDEDYLEYERKNNSTVRNMGITFHGDDTGKVE